MQTPFALYLTCRQAGTYARGDSAVCLSPTGGHVSSISRHYPVVVQQDSDGFYIVECPVLDGCRSYGGTLDEALANIKEAIEVCVEEDSDDPSDTIFVGVRDIELRV